MQQVKHFIEHNFFILLFVGFVTGFFAPSFGEYADEIVIFLTAFLIFLSCADIKPKEFLDVDIFQIATFTVLRYALFPLFLFYVAHQFIPDYAIGILLLALMPAGVSVPSLCSMAKSNVALGLSLTVISSVLVLAFIPSIFSFLGRVVNVDLGSLMATLVIVVFLPIVIYFGIVYRMKKVSGVIKKYNNSLSVMILSFVLFVVAATQKEDFINNIEIVYTGFIVMMVLFLVFYVFGIIYAQFVPENDKIPYIYSSGAMNNSLAVGLAFIYFSAEVTLFIILSEIVFSLYIAVSQWIFSRKLKSTESQQ